MIEIIERDGAVIFAVRVQPRSSRDAIEGEYQGALKVRLTAPPVEGRANEALRRLLAERLNVPVSAVRIVAGEKSRAKRVLIAGVSRERVIALASKGLFAKGAQGERKEGDSGDARHKSNPGGAARQQD